MLTCVLCIFSFLAGGILTRLYLSPVLARARNIELEVAAAIEKAPREVLDYLLDLKKLF